MSNENQTTSSTAVAAVPAPKKETTFFSRNKKKIIFAASAVGLGAAGYFLWTKTKIGEASPEAIEALMD